MTIEGTWDCAVNTPIGLQTSVLTFNAQGHAVTGHGVSADGDVAVLRNIVVQGDKVSWAATVEKPVKLDVKVEVTVAGNSATGKVKLGIFGTSPVNMSRRAP